MPEKPQGYMCAYYASKNEGDWDYYETTETYDSVADALIEAANTVTQVEESIIPIKIDVRIINILLDLKN